MFSLIITIVSIALVVLITGATMYYGGDTLTQGRDRAEAAAFVTGGQQVSGALQMHNAMEGEEPEDVAALVFDKYLTAVPSVNGGDWAFDNGIVTANVNSASTCAAINKQAGLDGEIDDIPPTFANTSTYGCSGADGARVFSYRY